MSTSTRITLAELKRMKADGRKIAMLTAYDYPTAAAAESAGVHSLLIGDSLGTVLLGRESTRSVPFELMIVLAEAVRRGAPHVYVVGDMPFERVAGGSAAVLDAARRYCDEAGCDAIKIETATEHVGLVEQLARAGIETIAHLGLRPQSVLTRDGYKPQARDDASIAALVSTARQLVGAGAAMLLLEAVPAEASAAVMAESPVPVIGCGAGPACDGHVVVTYDMLGIGTARPPRFVPVLANVGQTMEEAMRRYVQDIACGAYPAPQHVYPMRKQPSPSGAAS